VDNVKKLNKKSPVDFFLLYVVGAGGQKIQGIFPKPLEFGISSTGKPRFSQRPFLTHPVVK
jgi:hypothetical protein